MKKINRITKNILLRWNPIINNLYATKYLRHRNLNKFIQMSTHHSFIFYRVPKVANSTLMKTIMYYDPLLNNELNNSNSTRLNIWYLNPDNIGIQFAKEALDQFFKCAFVRNPLNRILSAYIDKIANPEDPSKGGKPSKVKKRLGKSSGSPISFEDFIRYLECGGIHDDVHWTPQANLLPPVSYLNFIGHVENMEKDIEKLINHLFPNVHWAGISENRPHSTGAQNKYTSYYNTRLEQTVADLYRKDFNQFGYS